MSARPAVAVVLPTLWDRRQIEASETLGRLPVEVRYLGGPDAEVAWDVDVPGLVRRLAAEHPDLAGATSSSDYPGAVAAALLARQLGRPGADPRAVLATGHKGEARAVHTRHVPEAVPWWRVLEVGAAPPLGVRFPCFVKPARGSFSVLARQVDDPATLARLLAHPSLEEHRVRYAHPHRALARHLEHRGPDPGLFLAEELLDGAQVTVEGWVEEDTPQLFGCVDSIFFPGTRAFARFETPSRLPANVQQRLLDLTRRVVAASGLTWTCFNAEWVWDAERDRLSLLELNPRIAGQFADLWERTLGLNGYEVALALALGRSPPRPAGGRFACAASVPLRTFEAVRVERAPSSEAIEAVEARHPGTNVWWECTEGEVLAGFDEVGERQGHRYAVLNLGAARHDALPEEAAQRVLELGARLVPQRGA
jgi:biotin carboxylase